jgi:hypothetical protein
MNLLQNKKTLLYVLIITLLAAIVAGLLILGHPAEEREITEERKTAEGISMRPDAGLNVEFIDLEIEGAEGDGAVQERAIYERWRFYDPETDEVIDIRRDDIRAFVTPPFGEEEKIATGNIYYLWQILPTKSSGEYLFRIEMPDGTERRASLQFVPPQEAPLVLREVITGAGGKNLQVLEMSNLNLNDAESVFHVRQDNFIDFLFPNEDGRIAVESEILRQGDHVFLAKKDGAWYYSTFFNPEE